MTEKMTIELSIRFDTTGLFETPPTAFKEILPQITNTRGEQRDIPAEELAILYEILKVSNARRLSAEELELLRQIHDGTYNPDEVPMYGPEWVRGMLIDDARRAATEMGATFDDEVWDEYQPDEYDEDPWSDETDRLQWADMEPHDIDYEGLGFDPYAGQILDDDPIDPYEL